MLPPEYVQPPRRDAPPEHVRPPRRAATPEPLQPVRRDVPCNYRRSALMRGPSTCGRSAGPWGGPVERLMGEAGRIGVIVGRFFVLATCARGARSRAARADEQKVVVSRL